MERCSKCNSVLKSDSKFCPEDGAVSPEGNGKLRDISLSL